MKISTEIDSLALHIGEERAIETLAQAGFDAWDFSMFRMCGYDWEKNCVLESSHPLAGNGYLKFARKLKETGLACGIVCSQSHAPFPSCCAEIRSYFRRAIECTAEAGGEICVIHPDNDKSAEENAELYLELLPFAREHGVKLAAENMWNWDEEKDQACFAACATPEDFCAHLGAVHDESLVACLDIGHAEMRGCGTSAVEMIRALGPCLQALHIHDNDKRYDLHQIPFSMAIDFVPIVKTLREVGYSGYFTLEASSFLENCAGEGLSNGVRRLAASARRLADMFEGKL